MKNFGLMCILSVVFFAGCGKKSNTKHTKPEKATAIALNRKTASTTPAPVAFLDDEEIVSDFAFIDDELTQLGDADSVTTSKKDIQAQQAPAAWSKDALVAVNDLLDDPMDNFLDDQTTTDYSFQTVHFDFNQSSIRSDQYPLVKKDCQIAKEALRDDASKKVVIGGHCDQIGAAAFNLALSQRRAEAIKTEMVQAGIPSKNIKTLGYGYERPVVFAQVPSDLSNKNIRTELITKLSANRRAEIVLS